MAEALAREGHEVVHVGCGGIYRRFCISMRAMGLEFDADDNARAAVCRDCDARKRILRDSFGFAASDLSELLTGEDMIDTEKAVATVTRDNFLDFSVSEVPVGRLALYELILDHKKQDLQFSEPEWQAYRVALNHAVLTIRAADRLFEQHRPDRVVVYNGLYSVNRVVCEFAERRGIPAFFLHGGGNLAHGRRYLMIGRGNAFDYFRHLRDKWSEVSGRPCPASLQKEITEHFIELFRGRHFLAYSSAHNAAGPSVRQRYGVPDRAKLIVAAMSSYDERFAGEVVEALDAPESLLFERQADWIAALIAFVRQRADLFLLIRVHPREFPNKREGVKSEHARLLETMLIDLPANARVNWPSDHVSLYDIAQEADLFLNAWSSVGKEMSLLGLPVVLYSSELVTYPASLNDVGETFYDYFAKIDDALSCDRSWDRIRTMYRWYALEFGYSLIDISEGYRSAGEARPLWKKVLGRLRRARDRYATERRDCRNRRPLRGSAAVADIIVGARASPLDSPNHEWPGAPSERAESEQLRREVARLVEALGAGRSESSPRPLADRLAAFVMEKP